MQDKLSSHTFFAACNATPSFLSGCNLMLQKKMQWLWSPRTDPGVLRKVSDGAGGGGGGGGEVQNLIIVYTIVHRKGDPSTLFP